MPVTKQEAEKIAKLAKLSFTENEMDDIIKDMNQILEYMDKLNELDTTNVDPLIHPIEGSNFLREDEVKPSLTTGEALRNAPATDGKYFIVPKVIDK